MATLSSPGIGSNLDIKGIVEKLMTAERRPITLLETKQAGHEAKVSALGALKSSLFTLQKAAQDINLTSAFKAVKASVADEAVLSATATSAIAGSYNIEVKSLAQPQKLTSSVFSTSDSVVGEGTLTLSFGTYSDAATPPVTFTSNSKIPNATITIDSTNHTLSGIRDAINDANTGVTASIINDGTGYRLSVTSKETGVSNAVKIEVAEDGAAGLAQMAYDGSTDGVSNMTQNVAAADAVIKVDSVTITSSSNTITDAIQGVTLNLTKETAADTPTKLTLARDTASTRAKLEAFVKAYNDVNKQMADSTAYDTSTGKGSVLTGDATIRSIQSQLRNTLSGVIAGAPPGLSVLANAGIGFQKDGTLAIDDTKLDAALANPLLDLSRLFTTSDSGGAGFASRVTTLISGMIFGDNGTLNSRIDGINSSIKDIGTQVESNELRMNEIERRYNAQFSALDLAISSMSTTSSFLTQQLSALQRNS